VRQQENWIRYDHNREDVYVYVKYGCFHDKVSTTTGDVVGVAVVPTTASVDICEPS
jgi:hypothetical protein